MVETLFWLLSHLFCRNGCFCPHEFRNILLPSTLPSFDNLQHLDVSHVVPLQLVLHSSLLLHLSSYALVLSLQLGLATVPQRTHNWTHLPNHNSSPECLYQLWMV
ncbi:hypothetical protein BRARA_H01139 [Brassica rapa]|uniref:Uncharacterized protein n=1 Tax=Brassica campestris TaxID=3711 RepID=A0A397YC11_BRACM|nr:hypothetical protein BRARA_H01139 [Brassica rapa]